jgi:hypothetical protein
MCYNGTLCTQLSYDTQYRESGVMRPVREYCSDFRPWSSQDVLVGAGLGADEVSLYCDRPRHKH